MEKNSRHTLRTIARKDYTLKPTLFSEMICGILAIVTAVLIWLGAAPL